MTASVPEGLPEPQDIPCSASGRNSRIVWRSRASVARLGSSRASVIAELVKLQGLVRMTSCWVARVIAT